MRLRIADLGLRIGLCAAGIALLCATAHAAGTWTPAGSLANARGAFTATLLPSGKVLVAGGVGPVPSAELYDPGTNTWSAAGSLATARGYHTATLLPNGNVLIAGGGNSSGALASAELYDPGTNTWGAAGSLATARGNHTATLLPSGKVLVAGGYTTGNVDLASAELYDPGTNTWSAAGSLATARGNHTATLLPGGNVLVAGGKTNTDNVCLASGEVYDSGTNTWSAAGSLATARYWHTATLLPSGNVLVAGGGNNYSPFYLASAELYDPRTNTWSAAGSLATGRQGYSATLLPSGQVLIAGGFGGGSLASVELYDPGTNMWSAAGSLAAARGNHTATLLPSGNVLVVGGYEISIGCLASAELYDPGTPTWNAAGSLATARLGHTATLLPNGNVLVAGGGYLDANANLVGLASTELYDSGTNTWRAAAGLAAARYGHIATLLPNGKVLVAGGGPDPDTSLATAELYDPGTNTWSAAGSLANARLLPTATLLPAGKVLVAGGLSRDRGGVPLASAEMYDQGTNTWSAAGGLATARGNHTATLLPNGNVLIAGGENSSGVLATVELYDPGTNTWSDATSLATARSRHTATPLPSGNVLVAGGGNTGGFIASAELYDPGTKTWIAAGSVTTARAVHSATLLPSGNVLVAGGASHDANGNLVPLAIGELYDQGTNTWSTAGSLATARYWHTATLLSNGNVLVAGGGRRDADGNPAPFASAELYDAGLGFLESWRPVISSATSPLILGSKLSAGGSGFKGISEASGGGYSSSATNYPIVQLRSLVNEQMAFVLADPASSWSDTAFTSVPVNNFPPGYAHVTVFTNGIPSMSRAIVIQANSPPVIESLTASQNPVRTGVEVAFTVKASDADGGTLTYTWDFGDGTPTFQGGSEVKHTFATEGTPTVAVYVSDGTSVTSASLQMTVYAPIIPPDQSDPIPNPITGTVITNPLDNISVQVVVCEGGVVELEITLGPGTPPDAVVTTVFSGSGGPLATVTGLHPVCKFAAPGIYIVTVTVTDAAGNVLGTVRVTLPISEAETGGTPTTTPPTSTLITFGSIKGKFLFKSGKPDTVSFKGTIELPAGLDPMQEHPCWVAAGNVADDTVLTARGKGKTKGTLGRIKKLQVKYPRPKKPAKTTTAGQTAKVSFTLSVPDLDALGFATDGITVKVRPEEEGQKSVTRSIQVGLLLAGTAYRGDVPVQFKLSKKRDTGQIVTRRQ